MPTVLITGPTVEPVTLADALIQIDIDAPADSILNTALGQKVTRAITSARFYCEGYARRVFMTQTWQWKLDGWPAYDTRYDERWYNSLVLPKPPFQSVSSFTYTDTQGNTQDMFAYGFQVDPGSETQPARLTPPFAQPWPPLRMIPNNVQVTFRCGYGGPVAGATMTASSKILAGPKWNSGDVGLSISIPGAGEAAAALNSTIAAVDTNGQATLADSASTAVTGVTAFAGDEVPANITQAILFMTQFFFEQGATVDLPTPRVIESLLGQYRNLVA